ncbi:MULTISPECIES: hypothetical protein [unclassified Streptomyces]|uniref:hypothetical protein n=1 Tax=unclassified Streptomyces TaxID=2593676 RepID=UPI0002000746|nr:MULTISPECIES: hypothetical protein [unclassified Streptomyces]ASY34230.1 hypothetical protein CAC01_17440 [Streptomyces sp. CLI2509]MYQ60045.1 hypothetical protein [Streptomyces sp. SID4926]MYR28520.1 hypothetical protein [Streptomyces sp. SID4945]MYX24614.1 hypothetical protein [Streptomyces sp. SID8380]NJA55263.1 hypothetical protein [Streptomyces sp. NEAU-H3]
MRITAPRLYGGLAALGVLVVLALLMWPVGGSGCGSVLGTGESGGPTASACNADHHRQANLALGFAVPTLVLGGLYLRAQRRP